MAADIVFDICKLTPAEITLDIVGSAVEGGRSLSGVTQSIDYSGGGFVAVTYGGINLFTSAQAKEWNRLAGCLNGSVRTVEEAIKRGDRDAALKAMVHAEPELMKAAQRNIIHKNNASRKVSRLAHQIAKLAK